MECTEEKAQRDRELWQMLETEEPAIKRVAVYGRTDTNENVQVISEDFQVKHYKEYILSHENWILAGIYEDGRTTGTKVKHREQFQKMIEACENGEIDFIITRSVNCFSENVKECLSTIRKLKELKKPVDIYFEVEQMYAMDENTERILERISSGSQEK